MTINRHLALIVVLALIGTAVAERMGTVVATENAGIYTYVQLDLDGNKVWYAVPAVELQLGVKVVAPDGMAMKNFHSKTLDRTFELVYFADAITPAGGSQTPPALPADHPPISSAGFDFSGIKKPQNGATVAEIYRDSAALTGNPVIVRGIAVKVSNGIMGKNWIHLRDGTGEAGSDDLTITTTNTVKVGASITASGTLSTDLDFGYGYKYAVLLEEATVDSE